MKRLAAPTGKMLEGEGNASTDRYTRRGIIVHSGPGGEKLFMRTADFEGSDEEKEGLEGDVSFDDARIKSVVKNHNAWVDGIAAGYGGVDKMPDGAFPPLLDMHKGDQSTLDVIGRLNCLVEYVVMDIPEVGENCSCVVGDLTFLGEEVVKRAKDGRIHNLSVGINDDDTIGEVSSVITGAAPGAKLLKGSTKKNLKGDKMSKTKQLEAHKKKMTLLSGMKKSLAGLTTKVTDANKKVVTLRKESSVTSKLKGLVRSGKMTPAEFKKQDFKSLSALPDESLKTVLRAFDSREPVVMVGQRGSTSAADFSDIGKNLEKKQMKSLKAEIRADMKRLSGKKLGFGKEDDGDDDDKKLAGFGGDSTAEQDKVDMSGLASLGKCLESGDVEGAKKCYAQMMGGGKELAQAEEVEKELAAVPDMSEDQEKASTDLQSQVDELTTQLARVAGMVDELMDQEKVEGAELAADPGAGDDEEDEEKKKADLAADEEDKKKLAADKEEVKKEMKGKK